MGCRGWGMGKLRGVPPLPAGGPLWGALGNFQGPHQDKPQLPKAVPSDTLP